MRTWHGPYVDITLGQCWMIHDVKLIRHCRGYAVAMPSRKWRKGGTYTIAFPTTDAGRAMIEEAIMTEYKKVTATLCLGQRTTKAAFRWSAVETKTLSDAPDQKNAPVVARADRYSQAWPAS